MDHQTEMKLTLAVSNWYIDNELKSVPYYELDFTLHTTHKHVYVTYQQLISSFNLAHTSYLNFIEVYEK